MIICLSPRFILYIIRLSILDHAKVTRITRGLIYGYNKLFLGTQRLIWNRHAFPATRCLRIVLGMPRTVRHWRAARLSIRLSAIMGLILPLMACESFPLPGWREPEPQTPGIFIEAPAPVTAAPEKPLPPLPASKPPVRAPQARQGASPNGSNGAANDAHASVEPPPPVVGLNRGALIDQFGKPTAEREAAPARVIEFNTGECQLAAYLYFDTARNDFYVLQYQVNGITERNDAADRCLMRIRDAARR
jgi:hypothetical protein